MIGGRKEMTDVNTTIELAKSLGSENLLMAHEVVEIRNRSIKGFGPVSVCDLIVDAYNFGFAIGYRVGRGEEKKASATAPAK